eukprot:845716-Rhodomonas_salina.1
MRGLSGCAPTTKRNSRARTEPLKWTAGTHAWISWTRTEATKQKDKALREGWPDRGGLVPLLSVEMLEVRQGEWTTEEGCGHLSSSLQGLGPGQQVDVTVCGELSFVVA